MTHENKMKMSGKCVACEWDNRMRLTAFICISCSIQKFYFVRFYSILHSIFNIEPPQQPLAVSNPCSHSHRKIGLRWSLETTWAAIDCQIINACDKILHLDTRARIDLVCTTLQNGKMCCVFRGKLDPARFYYRVEIKRRAKHLNEHPPATCWI